MADLKPPRLAGDERASLLALLQFQRESFVRKVEGVSDADAATSPVGSGTSLLWLANHLADAETIWLLHRFAQETEAPGPGGHADTLAGALARYRQVWRDTDAVVAGADSLEARCPAFDDAEPVNLRWILGHLLEETARHAGHADILRELIDGQTGR